MLISGNHIHPTVYAWKTGITFDTAMKDAELRLKIESFMADMISSLRNEGCELIGHIKGLFVGDQGGYLMFSVTSYDEPVNFRGKVSAGIISATMTINVIAYGVEPEIVGEAFNSAFKRNLGANYD